jgi:hypothetical protein
MTTIQKHLSQRVKYLSVFDILSPLDVKPAIKDVGCVYFSGFPIHKYIDMYIKQPN